MQRSIFPPRLAGRVCAFCRQQPRQQQQRRIAATRNVHASSRQYDGVPALSCSTRPQGNIPHAPANVIRRSFSSSARVYSSPPGTETKTEAEAESDAAAAEATPAKPKVPQTHYEFFPRTLPEGPPPQGRFHIDVRALRREFLGLQAGAHPDLHPSHMKARAQATSARINEAFRTLENPLSRAQYVLSLRGIDVAGDETAKVEDPELLMQVLETRECIEEAEEEEDLEGLKIENEERISECEDRLDELFARDDLEEAKREVVRLRYWVNVRESINNWEKGKPVVLEH